MAEDSKASPIRVFISGNSGNKEVSFDFHICFFGITIDFCRVLTMQNPSYKNSSCLLLRRYDWPLPQVLQSAAGANLSGAAVNKNCSTTKPKPTFCQKCFKKLGSITLLNQQQSLKSLTFTREQAFFEALAFYMLLGHVLCRIFQVSILRT